MKPLTLASLPPDIIYAILRTASSDLQPRRLNGKRPRPQFLARASLICRTWREPAQALLSQNISLVRKEIERWVDAPIANGVVPSSVELTFPLDRSAEEKEQLARGAVRKSAGVKTLTMAGSGVGMEFLTMEELADLKHLTLDYAFVQPYRPIPTYTLPFHLTSLSLCAISDSSAILSLFTCSSATLTHLDISSLFVKTVPNTTINGRHLSTPYGTVVEHFHLIAATVTRLSIKLWRDDVAAFALLLPQATSLKSLDVSVHDRSQDDLGIVLDMVPTPLRTLKLARWPAASWEILGECLRRKALEKLDELQIHTKAASDDREAFVAECTARKIKVLIETP